MDRLEAMHVFVTVADLRGFAPAARKLRLSPSAVTRLIAALEEHVGARLLQRTTRQVTLNFLTRRAPLFSIPKASQPDHVRENAAALDFKLTPDELRAIDEAF